MGGIMALRGVFPRLGRLRPQSLIRRNASSLTLSDLEVSSDDPDLTGRAADIFRQHGACVVRGLNKGYVDEIAESVTRTVHQSVQLEHQGRIEKVDEGWMTPDGTLFIPAAWDGTKLTAN